MSTLRKIIFIDRDGTIIREPEDYQIDRLDKLALVDQVIPSLLALKQAGFEFVLVSNQDGLGTDAFPEEDFWPAHALMKQILSSQGIEFSDELIDRSMPEDQAATRKPGIGMLIDYLALPNLDRKRSCVIGDRPTDLELAANMKLDGYLIDAQMTWPRIVEAIVGQDRQATVERNTRETRISVSVNLDRQGENRIETGLGFFDHMLEQLALHGGFRLQLQAEGDLHIDEHHTVEDVALALGQCLRDALGDKRGIGRYGATTPMDESLARVAIDLSGRPIYVQKGDLRDGIVESVSMEMVRHFFQSLSQSLAAAIHVEIYGENSHHVAEALFKGTGQALKPALAKISDEVRSSKGMLA